MKIQNCFQILSTLLFAAFVIPGRATVATSSFPNFSDEKVEEFRKAGNIHGLQLAVISDKQMTVKKYGVNRDGKEWSDQDLLRIASVSKTFVAALFFQVADFSGLSESSTLDQFFSSDLLPKIDFKKVRISDLLRHSSGIPDYFTNDFIQFILENPSLVKTEDQALAAVKNLDPLFEPGTSIGYSNTNYVLLGLILDSVAKKQGLRGHQDLLRKYILEPTHLRSTFYEHKESGKYDSRNVASGFLDGNDFLGVQQGYGLANGGLLSTIQDTATFFDALFDSTSRIGLANKMVPAENENFGLGLYRLHANKTFIGHTGEFAGYLSFAAHNPQTGVTIVGFANDSSELAKKEFGKLQEYLLNLN